MKKSIARIITLLGRRSQLCIGIALRKYGLTSAEQPFYMALLQHEGITQEELTGLVGVDKAMTARAVKSLEDKGLLLRCRDIRDRRQNRLYLTEKAKHMVSGVLDELHSFNALLTRGIPEEELELVYRALQTMEENIRTYLKEEKTNGTDQ